MPRRLPILLSLVLVLALTAFAYWPGLSGGFLFDDYANLPALGAKGPVDNGPALWRYLTSGHADPTGRPVAMASFLIDAHDWPASPAPFLRTNLWLHLLNIALLAGLLLALGRAAGVGESHAQRGAVLGAALWGLHPLFVSTTFYIVQREAMLPATFILGGLLLWLAGRRRWQAGQAVSGAVLEWLGLGGGTLLATLSKADGALMPFYALLIEWLVLSRHDARPAPRGHRLTLLVLGVLPALAIVGYLVSRGVDYIGAPPPFGRDWTVAQRLLSEPRVIFDYLKLLWLPRPFTPGLFNDQIHASTSLWHPATTLPALLGVGALLSGALVLHRRAPLWALVVLFYFAGQLLESTSVPLELYFEHRNYVPALLMFWPLALWLTQGVAPTMTRSLARQPSPDRVSPKVGSDDGGRRQTGIVEAVARGLLALLVVAMLAGMTHARASVWGDQTEQALLWARLNPDSPRAQSYAAQVLTARGRPRWGQAHLRPLLAQYPSQIQIAFNLVGADCALGALPQGDIDATLHAIRTARRLGALSFHWLRDSIGKAQAGHCHGLTMALVKRFIDAAWANPGTAKTAGWQQDILDLRGRFNLAEDQPKAAFATFARALETRPRASAALAQAATLGDAGHQHLALCELALLDGLPQPTPTGFSMARVHAWVLARQHYWPHELAYLRAALTRDMPADQSKLTCPDTRHGMGSSREKRAP